MDFLEYTSDIIKQKYLIGKIRTAQSYQCAFRSFKRYLNHVEKKDEIDIKDIDGRIIQKYEHYLLFSIGICLNSSSAYMRPLRASYMAAVYDDLCIDRHPFHKVYTGIDKTAKRAIDESTMCKIASLPLTDGSKEAFARDLFIFSFLTRGMAFIDIAKLNVDCIINGHIVYHRSKTKQQLSISMNDAIKSLISRYYKDSNYFLFPILDESGFDNKTYDTALHQYNIQLHKISKRLQLDFRLTSYVARHTWASLAHKKNIPISIISESMGHTTEKTTRIYLNTFETSEIDKNNEFVISNIKNCMIRKVDGIFKKELTNESHSTSCKEVDEKISFQPTTLLQI